MEDMNFSVEYRRGPVFMKIYTKSISIIYETCYNLENDVRGKDMLI